MNKLTLPLTAMVAAATFFAPNSKADSNPATLYGLTDDVVPYGSNVVSVTHSEPTESDTK